MRIAIDVDVTSHDRLHHALALISESLQKRRRNELAPELNAWRSLLRKIGEAIGESSDREQ